ncbi:hypothetical protein OAT67_09275, partial [Bacteriovoracaceae bacterium]|nr:hypothetical protein [Bacteriovoracaceae bacterium]
PGVDKNKNGVLDRIEIKFLATLSHVPNPRRKWLKHYGMLMYENFSQAYTEDFTDDEFREYWWSHNTPRIQCFAHLVDYLSHDLDDNKKFKINFKKIYHLGVPSNSHDELMDNVLNLFRGRTIGIPLTKSLLIMLQERCGKHDEYIEITKVMYENFIRKYPKGDHTRFFHKKISNISHNRTLGDSYEKLFKILHSFYSK